MPGIVQYYEWLEGKPRMNMKQIAIHENVSENTMRFWFHECQKNIEEVKERVRMFRTRKHRPKAKLYPYMDGKEYTIKEIQKHHPDLSIPLLQQRYRQKDPGDWDSIFAPPGKAGGPNKKIISDEHLKGLGPRGDINKIPDFTEYEKRLWELG